MRTKFSENTFLCSFKNDLLFCCVLMIMMQVVVVVVGNFRSDYRILSGINNYLSVLNL